MTCKCGSTKFLSVYGKTSDMCCVSFNDGTERHEGDGYVPRLGFGGGDDVQFKVCVSCGTIQNWQPLSDEEIIEALEDM